jgi:iron(III) transport system ATP-binding protein
VRTRIRPLSAQPRGSEDPGSALAGIALSGVTKTFVRRSGETVSAVDDITLDVEPGEFLVLLGPSGCGKTTLLRLIGGLEQPQSGRIVINGSVVYDSDASINVAPENRPASMVFQSYALWPHMTAFENVAYPLRSQRVADGEVRQRVAAVLDMVGVRALAEQYPAQLSGGQQQRLALARSIVAGEDTVLFDEPLSNVDAKVRDHLRFEILGMQRKLGFTAVYVTHDQEEAMTLGTRIAVLREGRIAQLGRPRDVYEHPTSRYVANFVGAADEFEGRVISRDANALVVESAVGKLFARPRVRPEGDRVVVVVRPEAWRIDPPEPLHENSFAGVVEASMFLGGARTEYLVRVNDVQVRVWGYGRHELPAGTRLVLDVDPEHMLVYGVEQ